MTSTTSSQGPKSSRIKAGGIVATAGVLYCRRRRFVMVDMSVLEKSTVLHLAILAAILLVGCGGRYRSVASSTTATSAAATSAAATSTTSSTITTIVSSTTSTTDPAPRALLRVWFLLGERLVPIYRHGSSPDDAVAEVVRPPRSDDLGGPGAVTTAIPSGTRLRSISIADRIANIDLSSEFESGGGSLSMMARLAQLVYTATENPAVDRVRLHIDGVKVDSIGGEGVNVSQPLGREDFVDFRPRVMLTDPLPGATVTSPFRIAGVNSTYENTVALAVVDDANTTLITSFTTGRGPIFDHLGRPMWGPFEASIALDTMGTGAGLVVASEASAEDGRVTSWFAVPVVFGAGPAARLPDSTRDPVSTPDTPGGPGLTAALVDVRTARHPGFERVVFEFANTLPGYSVGYVRPPITADPSDLPIDLLADGVLVVRMSSASGVDLTSPQATETYTGPSRIAAGYPAVHEVIRIGDFEGVLQWAISTWTRPPFRVMTLSNPPRLIIDVASAAVLPPNT